MGSDKRMTVADVRDALGWSLTFIREWIASGSCPFGVCVRKPGSSVRTFNIDRDAWEKWRSRV